MSKIERTSQTDFSYEEPIFSGLNVELPVEPKPVVVETKTSKKKKFIIIGIAVFLLLLIIVVVLIKLKKAPVELAEEDDSTEITEDLTPFELRIKNARADLEIADPSNQDLTYPPVDMKLRIDVKER